MIVKSISYVTIVLPAGMTETKYPTARGRVLSDRHADPECNEGEASLSGTRYFAYAQDGKRGFTLIEMSIVLVIIGLIIGGILVGRDLISASEVTAQISQITKYNSAVNTFHNKYGGIPGDLNVSLADQFGFVTAGCTGGQGSRDGNGLIDGSSTSFTLRQTMGETYVFWADISKSNLTDVNLPINGAAAINCAWLGSNLTSTIGPLYVGDYFPPGKIGHNSFIYVYENNGANWYGLSAVGSVNGATMYSGTGIPVIQAYNIDKKIDDGLPATGSVIAAYLTGVTAPPVPTALTGATDTTSTCYSGSGSTYAYSISTTANQGAGLNCALSFKFE